MTVPTTVPSAGATASSPYPQIGQAHGSGLGRVRRVVEHACAWLLANKRLDRRQDRLGRMNLARLTAACIFILANRVSAF
ncbi:MAG: hypothetical protein ACJ8H8_25470 [Geminicoccaceae bacterium]